MWPAESREAVSAEHTGRAIDLVNGERQDAYGHPLPNHRRIADFWTVRLSDKLKPGCVIEPHEAAAMMRLVKEARLMNTRGHEDSLIDISGYVEVERLIHEEQARLAREADAEVERLHAEDRGHDGTLGQEWSFSQE